MLRAEKRTEFTQLYQQFAQEFLSTADGQRLLAAYDRTRKAGQENYQTLQTKVQHNKTNNDKFADEFSDAVLLKLLPYADSVANRWKQVWIHPTAAIPTNIKRWYEAAGHTNPDEWPTIAQAIWRFVDRCITDPSQLAAAVEAFTAEPSSKGFQAGMLSPILNALHPEEFALVHNRARNVLNYFSSANHSLLLSAYPTTNIALHTLLAELEPLLSQPSSAPPADLFDLFCTWLITERAFSFRQTHFWLLEIDDDPWQWFEWQEGNFVAMGWDELGDLSGLKRRDFDLRRDSLLAQYAGQKSRWTKTATNCVWRFARQLHEGDRILVYRRERSGNRRLLGVGTITAPYFYVAGAPASHRYPVEWQDLTERHLRDDLLRKPLALVDRTRFETIAHAPPVEENFASDTRPIEREIEQPEFLQYFAPIVDALQQQGGTAPAQTITAQILADLQNDDPKEIERIKHRIYRARTALARAGLLELRQRGTWSLTSVGLQAKIDDDEAMRLYQEAGYQHRLDQTLQNESPQIKRLAEAAPSYGTAHIPNDSTTVKSNPQPKETAADAKKEQAYSLADCARETYLDESTLARWAATIERKGQAIFYGPPGTGKTYIAQHLARHLVSGADGFSELIQFHPAYAYEDFIQGIRPQSDTDGRLSYPLVPGRFLDFCRRAAAVEGRCVLIIDEINRANLAAVFGELMYLLEYRAHSVKLAGGDTSFRIPRNVRIIGTMNTADRSIALVDHALRRRFAFIALSPNYDILRRFHAEDAGNLPASLLIDRLVALLQRLNQQIDDQQYAIGVSFFLQEQLQNRLADIWQMEIEPYLEELFFDQPELVEEFRWEWVRSELGL